MFLIVTLASVVASQALITATFSVVSQAIQQGFFPQFRVRHTSKTHTGQICAPRSIRFPLLPTPPSRLKAQQRCDAVQPLASKTNQ